MNERTNDFSTEFVWSTQIHTVNTEHTILRHPLLENAILFIWFFVLFVFTALDLNFTIVLSFGSQFWILVFSLALCLSFLFVVPKFWMDAQNKLNLCLSPFITVSSNVLIGLIWNGFSLRVSVFITSILLLWKQDKYAIFPMYFPVLWDHHLRSLSALNLYLLIRRGKNASAKSTSWQNICSHTMNYKFP